MKNGLDLTELEAFGETLLSVATQFPEYNKKVLRKSGSKLLQKTKARARVLGVKTGNYKRSIKRGRVYYYDPGHVWAIRVYSGAPHAHLIEEGHDVISHGQWTGKRAPAYYVFQAGMQDYSGEFARDVENMLDEIVGKLK